MIYVNILGMCVNFNCQPQLQEDKYKNMRLQKDGPPINTELGRQLKIWMAVVLNKEPILTTPYYGMQQL